MRLHPQEWDPHLYVRVWVSAGTGAGGQKFAWGWPVIITTCAATGPGKTLLFWITVLMAMEEGEDKMLSVVIPLNYLENRMLIYWARQDFLQLQ